MRRAVLANMADEKGGRFAGKPGARGTLARILPRAWDRAAIWECHRPLTEVRQLISFFHDVASEGSPEEALAAFYAYESQVPRVAKEKARGLREMYGADEKTCGYFTLHATADVYHAQVWRQQLAARLQASPEAAEKALAAGEGAAKALWRALDGIEARRTARAA